MIEMLLHGIRIVLLCCEILIFRCKLNRKYIFCISFVGSNYIHNYLKILSRYYESNSNAQKISYSNVLTEWGLNAKWVNSLEIVGASMNIVTISSKYLSGLNRFGSDQLFKWIKFMLRHQLIYKLVQPPMIQLISSCLGSTARTDVTPAILNWYKSSISPN